MLVPVALAVALWFAWPRVVNMRPVALIAVCAVFAWVLALTLAVQSLPTSHYPHLETVTPGGILGRPFDRPSEYYSAVPTVQRLGPRAFGRDYPSLVRERALPLHASTHPPGGPILLWALWVLAGHSLTGVSLITAVIGAAGVASAYAIAREVWGEAEARSAALLFACAPGVLIYSFTSMDAVFMTAFGLAVAAIVRAARSDAWAVVAGVLVAVAMSLTWGAFAAVPVAAGVVWLARRDGEGWGILLRRSALGLLGFGAATIALWGVLGVNLAGDLWPALHNQVGYHTYDRPFWYWWIGNEVAFLITAGIAQTALFAAEVRRRLRERRPGFEWVVIATLLLATASTMYKGETDHNWLIFLPMFVSCAGAGTRGDRNEARVAALGGVGQAALTEALFYTGW
jgi:4-amino-4-deoxy-L-arabinose transferase-like glycosyltransferase